MQLDVEPNLRAYFFCRYRIWEAPSTRPASTSLDWSHQQCACRHCTGESVCWSETCGFLQGKQLHSRFTLMYKCMPGQLYSELCSCSNVQTIHATQGLAMQRILELMAEDHDDGVTMDCDFVLVAGHFLMRDENIFTYFEGQGVKIDSHSKFWLYPLQSEGYIDQRHSWFAKSPFLDPAMRTSASCVGSNNIDCPSALSSIQYVICSWCFKTAKSDVRTVRNNSVLQQLIWYEDLFAAKSAVQANEGLAALHDHRSQHSSSASRSVHPVTRTRHLNNGLGVRGDPRVSESESTTSPGSKFHSAIPKSNANLPQIWKLYECHLILHTHVLLRVHPGDAGRIANEIGGAVPADWDDIKQEWIDPEDPSV